MVSITRVKRVRGADFFRKRIGGELVHLGSDEAIARKRAGLLVAAHEACPEQWGAGTIEAIWGAAGLAVQKPRSVHGGRERGNGNGLKLHDLAEALAVDLGQRGRSIQHQTRARQAGAELARLSPNVDLNKLDRDELRRLAQKLRERELAPASKATLLCYWRLILGWAIDAGHWVDPPSRWERLLRADGLGRRVSIETIDVATLKKLYKAASPEVRAYMLLSLNCGFTQLDLGTIEADHVVRKGKTWTLRRERHKTGVGGVWKLWPETVAAMKLSPLCDLDGKDGLLLRTPKGKPLCCFAPSGQRRDRVASVWADLRTKTKVGGSFKLLRKTGATMIAQTGGDEVAQRYLAHAPTSVARRHYVAQSDADFVALHKSLSMVRQKLGLAKW